MEGEKKIVKQQQSSSDQFPQLSPRIFVLFLSKQEMKVAHSPIAKCYKEKSQPKIWNLTQGYI